MVFKAVLFFGLAAVCGLGLWLQAPRFLTLALVLVLAWAVARLYYFLFYVLHAYVDPSLRYSGLLALVRHLTAKPRFALVRVLPQRRWTTRPTLVETEGDLERVREIGRAIEKAGLGTAKVLMFANGPTLDLLLETTDPKAGAEALALALVGYQVAVEAVGRPGDLAYAWHLWRHL